MPSIPAPADGVDDTDALPAVGKVWDTGPKRSLSEILAAAQRQQQRQAPTPAGPPPAQRSATAGVPADLATLWSAAMQQVHDTLGATVHVPLMSGDPRREGDQIIVLFGGALATMARLLERTREQVRLILSEVAGQQLGLRYEADESAPARTPTPQPTAAPRASQANPALSAVTPPAREGIPLTPELRAQLEKDPLIRAIMEQFNGSIVKVEEP